MSGTDGTDGHEHTKGPDGGADPARRVGRKKDASMIERENELLKEIDANLQRVYRDTLEEPIPARFLDLIAELRDKLRSDGG
jgi:hypothetical protein